MKNFFKFLGIISLALVIGFSMVACGDDEKDTTPSTIPGGGGGGGGGGGDGGAAADDGNYDADLDQAAVALFKAQIIQAFTAAGGVGSTWDIMVDAMNESTPGLNMKKTDPNTWTSAEWSRLFKAFDGD